MAKACPACGRPNGDRAEKCLYCTAPLPAAPEPEVEPETPSDRHLVILLPLGEPTREMVEELSRLSGLSAYDARMSLRNRRPRLFRRLSSSEEARALSRSLATANIPHYAVAETAVLSVPVSPVRRMTFHERHLRASLDGAPFDVPYADLLLLVRGEIERERHHEKRLGTARGASQRVTPGLRLHLYAREASVVAEVDPETFDWDVLGEARTQSALINLQKLLSSLMERAPGAELDEGFDAEPAVLSRASGSEDVTSALVATEKGGEGVVYDNEAQFRYYSRWRYRLARHLASGDATTA